MNVEPLLWLADLAATFPDALDIYAGAIDSVILCLRADRAGILTDDERGHRRFRRWRGLSKEYRAADEAYLPWPSSAHDPRAVLVADVLAEPLLVPLQSALLAEGVRALAFLPLAHETRLVGSLSIYYNEPHPFSEEEVQIGQIIARQVTLGLGRIQSGALITDLRERTARADARLARERMEVGDDLLAMIGHELRNPLNAVLNAALVLERPVVSETMRALAHGILRRQVAHLGRLLDDVLDEARTGRGLLELRWEQVDMRTAVSLAIEELSHRLVAKELELGLSLPDRPVMVSGDDTRLRQVVANLLDNAIKYTPARGSISVVLRDGPEAVLLRVRDTGVGIPTDLLPLIFYPFVQNRQDLARSQGGLGLGLSLVKRIVELHGGSVSVSSDGTDGGAEFVVRLPLAVAAKKPSGPPRSLGPR